MKRTIALLLALILGLSLLAGCGAKDPETPDNPDDPGTPAGKLIKDKYFTLNEAEGWVFYERSGSLVLKHGDPKDSKIKMDIQSATLVTVQDKLDSTLKAEGAVQGENLTYAGIEYLVVERAERGEITLITAEAKPVADKDDTLDLVLSIALSGATIEQAAPVLETLKINAAVAEIKQEFPENDPVDNDHFSYTATGGWHLYNKFDRPYSALTPGELRSNEFFPSAYMEISWVFTEPDKAIETINFAFSKSIKRDDVTIAGITYTVYADEPGLGDKAAANTFLVAPVPSGGTIKIRIQSVGAEGAMPVLETIKLK